MYLSVYTFLYIRLTVPEEKKNNNVDRHIKQRQNKSYCQFFLPFLSVSLSSFQSSSTKKNSRRKEERSSSPQTNIIIGDTAIREALTILLREQITYLHTYIYISIVSSSLSSRLYYFDNCFLLIRFFFFTSSYITSIYNYQLVDSILPTSLVISYIKYRER